MKCCATLLGVGLLLLAEASSGVASPLPYPDASVDGIAAVKEWASRLPALGEAAYANRFGGKARYPSPEYWGDGAVYQIFVDRFNNGDQGNDGANLPGYQRDQERSGNLYDVHSYRHGGDLKGVTDRLDYIKDLGMKELWITPIFLNKKGDYHGYCVSDFLRVDPGFGTLEEFQDLVAGAHQRGMRVVLDVVVNHMCDPSTRYQHVPVGDDHYRCADALSARNWNGGGGGGGSVAGQGDLDFGGGHFGPFRTKYFFNRCGPNSYEDMTGTGNAAIYGDFVAGMFDFDTGNHDFQYIFTQMHKYWIAATDLDGFRLDAVKHVTEQFVTYFSPHVRHYAQGLGKSNFYLVGEVAASSEWQGRFLGNQYSNPANPSDHGNIPASATSRMWDVKALYEATPAARYPGLNGVYDFAHGGTARGVFRFEKDPMELEHYLYGGSYRNLAAQGDPGLLWNNVAIHDWPRFLEGWLKGRGDVGAVAQAYLAFSRGIPIVYYGAEQGLNGDCWFSSLGAVGDAREAIERTCKGHDHALYRQTMWRGAGYNLGSAVGSVARHVRIGRPGGNPDTSRWEADPFLDRTHPLFQAVRRFYNIRNSCIALRRGLTTFRWVSRSLVAFSRVFFDREVVVLINPGTAPTSLPTLDVDPSVNRASGEEYKNLLNGFQSAWVGTTGGGQAKLYFNGMTLDPLGVAVFVHKSNHGSYNSYLQTHLCLA